MTRDRRTYKAASFFSGIGGIDLPFSWLGFDIRLQVEIDPYCQKVLRKHRSRYWKHAKIEKDIRNVSGKKLKHIDVMFGGFPCQDISNAGKQNGVTEETRSGLWFEFLRIIGEARPKIILLENVDNISNVGGAVITASLAKAGYDAIWQTIQAAEIGAPHQRKRWFCIAIPNSGSIGLYKSSITSRRQNTRHIKRNNPIKECRRNYVVSTPLADRKVLRQKKGLAHSNNERFKKDRQHQAKARKRSFRAGKVLQRNSRVRTQSRLGRIVDGIPHRMDRHRGQFPARPNELQREYEPSRVTARQLHRVDRVKALGNAVVPQQVLPFAYAVKRYLDMTG